MDKIFLKYVKDKRNVLLVAVAFALGLILIFMGSRGSNGDGTAEDIEDRLVAVCSSVEGVGECEVLVYYSSDGDDTGDVVSVIVVCDGADSVEVRSTLTSMLSSLFGIGTNRVRIERRKK